MSNIAYACVFFEASHCGCYIQINVLTDWLIVWLIGFACSGRWFSDNLYKNVCMQFSICDDHVVNTLNDELSSFWLKLSGALDLCLEYYSHSNVGLLYTWAVIYNIIAGPYQCNQFESNDNTVHIATSNLQQTWNRVKLLTRWPGNLMTWIHIYAYSEAAKGVGWRRDLKISSSLRKDKWDIFACFNVGRRCTVDIQFRFEQFRRNWAPEDV